MVSTFSTKWEVTSIADKLLQAWRDKWESLSFILCLPCTQNYARHFKWSSLILMKIQRLCICIHIIQMGKQVKKANSLPQDHTGNNGRSGDSEPGLSDSRAWSLWKGSLGGGKKGAPVDWDLGGVAVLYHDQVLRDGYCCQSPEWTSKTSPLTWGGRDCEIGVDQKCEFWVPEGNNKAQNRDMFESGAKTC